MGIDRRMLVKGTQVNYYYVCATKLWLFSHGIEMERESDLVEMGRLVHEASFGGRRKDVMVDGRISIDFVGAGGSGGIVLHEVKSSASFRRAAEMQLLYYMYYMRRVKGVDVRKGVLHFVSSREVEELELTEEGERQVEEALAGIERVVALPVPPAPVRRRSCAKCSYRDLCWS